MRALRDAFGTGSPGTFRAIRRPPLTGRSGEYLGEARRAARYCTRCGGAMRQQGNRWVCGAHGRK